MIGVRDRSNILSSETMSCLRGDRQSIFKSNRSDKRIADLDQKRFGVIASKSDWAVCMYS